VLSAISVEKDVDGFHPLNMGRLCMKVRNQQAVNRLCMFIHIVIEQPATFR
jgi:5,10-methylene-tetrahydrofolate dehydrogenase/methenyl tetrahydrofolate cyclohydrolase